MPFIIGPSLYLVNIPCIYIKDIPIVIDEAIYFTPSLHQKFSVIISGRLLQFAQIGIPGLN